MFFSICFSLALFGSTIALEGVPSLTKLPEPLFEIVAVYDNSRSIYLFGGMNANNTGIRDIYKFDIYSETLDQVAQFPEAINQGSAHRDNDGSILYFGGEYGTPSTKSPAIWKFTPGNNPTVQEVGVLPNGIAGHCSAYDGYNTYLLTGGYTNEFQRQLYSFDQVRNTTYAFTLANPTPRTSSACALVQGTTYLIFGGWEDGFQNTAVKHDLSTGSKTILDSTFEFGITGSVAVTTGDREVYIVGGGNGDAEIQKHHLSTFDIHTSELKAHKVEGMRPNLYRPAVVHVPVLNRIYVFGGREYGTPSGTETVDEIFHIQLL